MRTSHRLPDSFDCRERWPNCISHPMDQKDCNACWAFSTVLSMSDRLRIKATKSLEEGQGEPIDPSLSYLFERIELGRGQRMTNSLSPHYMVENKPSSCSTAKGSNHFMCNMGCRGGYIDSALKYLETEGCSTIKDHLNKSPRFPLYLALGSYKINPYENPTTPQEIEANTRRMSLDLMTHGPIVVGFEVHQNFYDEEYNHYYTTIKGPVILKHAVSVIGWKRGPDGRSYWICRNSYGPSYMDGGYFYMPRGRNFCGIESNAYASSV